MESISWRLYLYELQNIDKLLNFSKTYSSIMEDKISNKSIAEISGKFSHTTKKYNRLLSFLKAQ